MLKYNILAQSQTKVLAKIAGEPKLGLILMKTTSERVLSVFGKMVPPFGDERTKRISFREIRGGRSTLASLVCGH